MLRSNFEIKESKEGFQVVNHLNGWITGHFKQREWAESFIEEKINPPKCNICGEALVTESVTSIKRCLKCEPFYNQKCGICGAKRAFCCC